MTATRPSLSLCMIVKNEEAFLGELLKAAASHCDEMIVVDTGSSDQTAVVAKSFGATVHSFAWTDDFSAARNFSLEKAAGDWILVLDADERLSENDWQLIRRAVSENRREAFDLCQTNYTRELASVGFKPNDLAAFGFESYPGFTESWLTRLFRNRAGFRFEGVVHEHIHRDGLIINGARLEVRLHHHGMALPDDKLTAKKRRYLALGYEKARRHPEDFKTRHELGVALWELGELNEAKAEFAAAEDLLPGDPKNLIALATVLQLQGQFGASEITFRKLLALHSKDPSAHAGLAGCLKAQGRVDEAIAELKKQIRVNPELTVARGWLHDCYAHKRAKDPHAPVTITVCYIAKNEEDCLGHSIANAKPHVDEIIVLDTGSTDRTRDIAREAGATVFESTWRDDFSWARNESLKHASSEWILVLDADEILSASDWRDLKTLLASPQVPLYFLVQTTYSDSATALGWKPNDIAEPEAKGYRGYFESPLVRLFKNTPLITFTGSVHEHAHYQDQLAEPQMTRIRIHHYGKFRNDDRMKEKYDLYHRIGLKKLGEMPEEPHAYYEMAVQLMELKKNDEVEAYFRKALALEPNHSDAVMGLAGFLMQQGRLAEALDQYIRLIGLKPTDPQTYAFTSSLLIQLKKYDLALNMIRTAKELGGEASVALAMNEGVINLQLGNTPAARLCFERAFKLNPRFAPVLVNLGLVNLAEKRFAESVDYLRQAVALCPDDDLGWQKLGEALFTSGERENSLAAFEKAHELAPDNADILSQIIINAHCLGRVDLVRRAEEKLFAAVKDETGGDGALRRIMQVYRQRGDRDGLERLNAFVDKGRRFCHN